MPIRILIADDHPLYRNGVAMSLAEEDGFEVVAACASASEAIEATARLAPDVVLLDISMPGNGLTAARDILARQPDCAVAMLTASEQDEDLFTALQAGARGYILKGVGANELIGAVRGLAAGESHIAPGLAARVLHVMRRRQTSAAERRPIDELTHREEEILRLVAQGMSNKEVGLGLNLQEKTVKHYMTAILQKLQARNRVEAALIARDEWNLGGK
ncbi:MAG: response regulator transcription factor [Paracoccaceae bacterium]